MGTDRVNHILADPRLAQKLRRFLAVLFRIKLKIYVMEKSGNAPEFLFLSIAQFLRVPAHHAFYRQRVLNMKRLFVIFL